MCNDIQQIKTGKDNYEPISDETILRITKVDAFSDSKMNNLMYEHHINLLKIAQKYKDREVGLFWDLRNINESPLVVIGERNGINIRGNSKVNSLVRNNNSITSVVVMHNHPRNGLFSSADIQSFMDYDSIYIMTAVCNDGTIYMMRKEQGFNPLLLIKYYNEGKERSDEEARAERLNKAKRMGIDINNKDNVRMIMQIKTKPYYYGIKNVAKHAKEIGITYRCSVKRKGGIVC